MEETSPAATPQQLNIEAVVKDILGTIEREREREIIARRFGLFDRKETLEQIGELLGITRERVRQLEKAVVAKLKAAENNLPHMSEISQTLTHFIKDLGNASKISDLTAKLTKDNSKIDQARVAFLAKLTPELAVVDEDDNHYLGAGLLEHHDEKAMKGHIAELVKTIKEHGEPTDSKTIHAKYNSKLSHEDHVAGLASLSKQLSTLNGLWGLTKWPTVNPKNIRDKIYLILQEDGKPMHFSEISKAIKSSDFKRKDVTTQAIHNELIKDKRFVLIGRGIYALSEWGYNKGTVADVITKILRKNGEPMHRDEIIKQVLKQRQVKETTILLNLQGKPQFKRVAKATYTLAEKA
ncbi:hypothetical protein KC878_03490 [Candidatus Saccharibacteria bacterium]|nr:hypothetical protein [Candidatus Saccharibacteria bacterium]MCB9821392.1 hypothetical protein [Candidatus Nomurabacteria bacterium]